MGLAIFTFFIAFLLVASGGLLLFSRDAMQQKDPAVLAAIASAKTRSLSNTIRLATMSVGNVVGRFEGVLPKSKAEATVARQRLIRAGYRKDSAANIFYGAKFLAMVAFVVLVVVTGVVRWNYFFVIIMALVAGFLAPDFWLGRRISARQKSIRLGLPDVLDLLIVCMEAGLSLDQATLRTVEELHKSAPAMSDELGMVVLEQRAGRSRSDAWKNMAERTDVTCVRNVVSMLAQSEQLGTSVAKTLRVHSETLRTQRVQQVEEQAAKATIKMLFPLVILIFPSIFLVTLGPAVILMMESLNSGFQH
jgi:tight adherence protein C